MIPCDNDPFDAFFVIIEKFQVSGQVLVWETFLYRLCGASHGNHIWRDVLRDDASRPDDRTFPYRHSLEDSHPCTDPDILFDSHWEVVSLLDLVKALAYMLEFMISTNDNEARSRDDSVAYLKGDENRDMESLSEEDIIADLGPVRSGEETGQGVPFEI